jgi:hypothetical protein
MATATKKIRAAGTLRHLSCADCRVRVRANAPEIDLLEGRCPICGATLGAVSSAAGVVGFRSFDLSALSDQGSSDPPPAPGRPADLATRREAALSRDGIDVDRWSDEGGSVSGEAVAEMAGSVIPENDVPARVGERPREA